MCFVRESQKYPDDATPRHAFRAARLFFPNWSQELADQLIDEFQLPMKKRIKKLSRGQLSAVGVIIGLAARAEITFFDEPYLGLDAVARQIFYDRLLEDYTAHPRTVILSSHLIDEVSNLIERVLVIDRGRIIMDEETDAVRDRAANIVGDAAAVDAFVAGREVIHRESLGRVSSVTVLGWPDPRRPRAPRRRRPRCRAGVAAAAHRAHHPARRRRPRRRRTHPRRRSTPMSRTLNVVRMQFVNRQTYIWVPLLVLVGAFVLSLMIFAMIPDDGVKVGGGSQAPLWYFLVVGVQSLTLTFPFSQAMSVTRREFYLGTLLTAAAHLRAARGDLRDRRTHRAGHQRMGHERLLLLPRGALGRRPVRRPAQLLRDRDAVLHHRILGGDDLQALRRSG